MKMTTLIALLLPALAGAAVLGPAQFPEIAISTDKPLYAAGDSGIIFVSVSTFGRFQEAGLEVVVTGPEGNIIGGAILDTTMPEKMVLNQDRWQTEQSLISENIAFSSPEAVITREVSFTVPGAAPGGTYQISALLTANGNRMEKTYQMDVINNEAVESVITIYIFAFVAVLGIIYFSHDRGKR
jgi:hypothetical protein